MSETGPFYDRYPHWSQMGRMVEDVRVAVDALQNGLRPMVVREAVGDSSAAAHDQSLFDLNAKYADVVTAEETLHYLRSVGHNLPPAS